MSGFLATACAEAAERVAEARRVVDADELRERARRSGPPRLAEALAAPGLAVIAEVKRASPSRGRLAWVPDPAALAAAYRRGGAAAVSVLTEPAHFHGSLADLREVADRGGLPALRKDFVVDDWQVREAAAFGAHGCLLIVAALDDAQLGGLLAACDEIGLDALVEVHDAEEAARAAAALDRAGPPPWGAPRLVGVNARDLSSLEVDRARFGQVRRALPDGVVTVDESGVAGPADAEAAAAAGADAVLVGEHLVRSPDPQGAVRELVAAGSPTGGGWTT